MNSVSHIISTHRKAKKMTLVQLSEELNKRGIAVKHKAVSAWESGLAQPSVEAFLILCEIFEINDIYEELYGENPHNPLSSLNEAGREKALEYISLLLKDDRYIKASDTVSDTPAEITELIKLFEMPVSAGTGNFLTDSAYEEVVRDASIPSGASFGVKISGDSMTPRYKNGQTIWIKEQPTLENGEIGVFLLNGSAYCKKFRHTNKGTALISLNNAYTPIKIQESDQLYIMGKVLN